MSTSAGGDETLVARLAQRPLLEQPPEHRNLTASVASLLSRPAVWLDAEATAAEAARTMTEQGIGSVLVRGVGEAGDDGVGIVTDRDLRRRVLAADRPASVPLRDIASTPLITVDASTPVFLAQMEMVRGGMHHLGVERGGELLGVVSTTDLARHDSASPLLLGQRLASPDSPFEGYARDVAAAVRAMWRGGLGAARIGVVVAGLHDALLANVLRRAEAALGVPPVPYAWLVFGSEGRREQTLVTDQDNALVWADADSDAATAPTEVAESFEYFERFAAHVVASLRAAGFPECPGGYMATRWRGPLSWWRERFAAWIDTPEPEALLEASIFFDFRAIGDLDLEPLHAVVDSARERSLFLGHMLHNARRFAPPIGLFGGLRTDDGLLDLKAGGIAPLVGMARVVALAAGSRARPTLERLEAGGEAGTLSRQSADEMREIFRYLLHLRLRAQLEQLRRGEPAGNALAVDSLGRAERRRLRDALAAVRTVQRSLGERFTGGLG